MDINKIKNCVFIGFIYENINNENGKECSKIMQTAAHYYQLKFIKGLKSISNFLLLISSEPYGSYPKNSNIIYKKKKIDKSADFNSIFNSYLNIPVIKQFYRFFGVLLALFFSIKKKSNTTIFIYSLYLPHIFAVIIFCAVNKFPKKDVIIIVPDIPNKYGIVPNKFTRSWFFYSINAMLLDKVINIFSKYILFTQTMSGPLGLNKKFLVIEGLVDNKIKKIPGFDLNNFDFKKRYILYTGSLDAVNGIDMLIESFCLLDLDCSLVICGSTLGHENLLRKASKFKNIHFIGLVDHDLALFLQRHALFLVNPRPNIGVFVKYSFPSKTFEYMLSGRPTVMFKLDGIPDEYYNYLIKFEDFTIESMAQTMYSTFSKSEEELKLLGESSKNYVLTNKSIPVQFSKILEYINEN